MSLTLVFSFSEVCCSLVLTSVCLSSPRRWFSIQNSQLVYQKKLKVSEASPGDTGQIGQPDVLLCWGFLHHDEEGWIGSEVVGTVVLQS